MSVSSSTILPGPFVADKLISPDAVTVPVNVGAVKVLLVSVSVVALPIKVSVDVGRVIVPVLVIDEIVGVVKVKPAIVVTVVPEGIDVEPIVGAE